MPTRWTAPGRLITAALATCGLLVSLAAVAVADDDTVPSQADVDAARAAATAKARDVAAVQADLVVADQRLQAASISAAKAGEAYNGALYRLEQARAKAAAAEQRARAADADVRRQQQAYGDALADSYAMSPQLSTIAAIVGSDGPRAVLEKVTTLESAEEAMSGQYDTFRATSTLATVARTRADEAKAEAARLEVEMAGARDRAQAAADAAAAEARAVADQKQALIAELARLQDVSVAIAAQRQHALEQQAAAAAAAAAQAAAEAAAQAAADKAAQEAADKAAQEKAAQEKAEQEKQDEQQPSEPDPTPDPAPQPAPDPAPAPSSGNAERAVAFAKNQIGEPYVWGADGPDSWDCSGLTMRAWEAGGRWLPHYSAAQYDASTPISPSDLRPGDLVFWGDNNRSSSIYHVAMYIGDGRIVHAPRTGENVRIDSMYYWIPPNFYARP